MVTVHHFQTWDRTRGEYVVHPTKSTMERVAAFGGEIVAGTAEVVAAASLDAEELFNPVQPGI
ncbi:MAG: hypothetical protein P4L72_11240 [Parvibaculum sp.]|uniref:hypothetical protein n=1 Tax=Parvibaculum sp. TaxID=2024848 RepID=UPI00283E80DC|nr:hypothetical protein [Parvibaculum sp.]MDR3499785.1 hypothetical protein [Parvibaculum sp.]